MTLKLLISAPFSFLPDLLSLAEDKFEVIYKDQASLAEVKDAIANYQPDGWITNPCPTYKIDSEVLNLANNLKIISTPSTGTNHIDIKIAEEKGIKIFSLRNSPVVEKITASSEYTFSLMLATVRSIPEAFSKVKSGYWRDIEGSLRSRELSSLTLGIVGCGRIGGNLIKYTAPHSMKVIVYDPYRDIEEDNRVKQYDNLQKLLGDSDVICICVHLNDETKGMIGSKEFNSMKSECYFINTSRGEIINEDCLLSALKSGKVKAAGIDVLCGENQLDNKTNKLIQYSKNNSNLIITPHIAGLTIDSERKAQASALDSCIKYFNLV